MDKYIDARGEIINILQGKNIRGVSLIFSKKGSVRSNHYHEKDWHYLYVISGKMEYLERPVGSDKGKADVIHAGEIVFSAPMMVHKTVFLEDTWLICLSKEQKDENHDCIKEEF